jgi:hypothetical protein
MSYGVTLLDTNSVRGLVLSLLVMTGLVLGSQPALAVSCARESATELMRRGDVAASGAVSAFVPLGFIFAADHVYKGNLPRHVLVLGQYHPGDVAGPGLFVVMRSHLPGVYSMDVCDGRSLTDASLGGLGEPLSPSADLPIAQMAVALLIVLALLLIARRGRGKPAAPAAAGAY